jgi:hypothetical protein
MMMKVVKLAGHRACIGEVRIAYAIGRNPGSLFS